METSGHEDSLKPSGEAPKIPGKNPPPDSAGWVPAPPSRIFRDLKRGIITPAPILQPQKVENEEASPSPGSVSPTTPLDTGLSSETEVEVGIADSDLPGSPSDTITSPTTQLEREPEQLEPLSPPPPAEPELDLSPAPAPTTKSPPKPEAPAVKDIPAPVIAPDVAKPDVPEIASIAEKPPLREDSEPPLPPPPAVVSVPASPVIVSPKEPDALMPVTVTAAPKPDVAKTETPAVTSSPMPKASTTDAASGIAGTTPKSDAPPVTTEKAKDAGSSKRPALLGDLPLEEMPLPAKPASKAGPPGTAYMVAGKRGNAGNRRKSQSIIQLLVLTFLANMLLTGAAGAWLYNLLSTKVDESMLNAEHAASSPEAKAAKPAPTPAPAPATGSTPVPSAIALDSVFKPELEKTRSALTAQIEDLQLQLQATQKRLADSEATSAQTAQRVQQMAVNAPKGTTSPIPAKPGETPPAIAPPAPVGNLTPSQNELVLLKERNRLTGYADEAIATGEREPYEQLWKAIDDPNLAMLVHAARSEILRVQNFYLSGTRLDRYSIAVGDYFPESATLRDSQLDDDKLITLIGNTSHPWQVRMKAANLLGQRRSTAVGDALVKTIKEDPNLDVVKEATFSFEQLTGFRAKLFEPTSLEAWWKQYNELPPPPAPPAPKTKKGDEAATPSPTPAVTPAAEKTAPAPIPTPAPEPAAPEKPAKGGKPPLPSKAPQEAPAMKVPKE